MAEDFKQKAPHLMFHTHTTGRQEQPPKTPSSRPLPPLLCSSSRCPALTCAATSSTVLRCMSLNMLRKPLLRLGVRLCFRPSFSMKSGCEGGGGRGKKEHYKLW